MSTLLVCLAAVSVACSNENAGQEATNMQSNDEQAIFSETEAFAEAWNKGDAYVCVR